MAEIINLKRIEKFFLTQRTGLFSLRRKRLEVLRNFNLTLDRGQVVAILGPNGAGKTTIFKMISTLVLPNSGNVLIDGWDTFKDPIQVRKRVSLVTSEERSFYFRLTGRENLLFFAALANIKKPTAIKRIEKIDEILNIKEHMNIHYQEFSTGLKQKLNLARGLVRDFEVLLLDEPIKSVDPQTSSNVMEYIKREITGKNGKTVLMTTHNLSEAEKIADRFIILDKGSIAADFGKASFTPNMLEDKFKSYF
jgi:ABC-2 type transport system ATP-binding protein